MQVPGDICIKEKPPETSSGELPWSPNLVINHNNCIPKNDFESKVNSLSETIIAFRFPTNSSKVRIAFLVNKIPFLIMKNSRNFQVSPWEGVDRWWVVYFWPLFRKKSDSFIMSNCGIVLLPSFLRVTRLEKSKHAVLPPWSNFSNRFMK